MVLMYTCHVFTWRRNPMATTLRRTQTATNLSFFTNKTILSWAPSRTTISTTAKSMMQQQRSGRNDTPRKQAHISLADTVVSCRPNPVIYPRLLFPATGPAEPHLRRPPPVERDQVHGGVGGGGAWALGIPAVILEHVLEKAHACGLHPTPTPI